MRISTALLIGMTFTFLLTGNAAAERGGASTDGNAPQAAWAQEILARLESLEQENAELQARIDDLELGLVQVHWTDIQGIPAGFADGVDDDTNTQLSEAEVDAFVANNGYLTSESDPTVAAAVKDGVAWGELTGIPAGFADGVDDDTNTQLSEAEVDAFVANNGYLTSESDPTVAAAVKDGVAWGELTGIPAGFADGVDDDTNTQLSEAEVDAFVANNGYLTSESDPTVAAAVKDGVAWGELTGIPEGFADGVDDSGASVLDPYVSVDTSSVEGLPGPHIIISGANVHVRNGTGTTDSTNGLGNLIIGYNELGETLYGRGGSHNVVVGMEHQYASHGGLVAGSANSIAAPCTSITGGHGNTVYGECASIGGGAGNTAEAPYASINGGYWNIVRGLYASILGGRENLASGEAASVAGGNNNHASGNDSTVSGGAWRSSTAPSSWRGGMYSSLN